MPTIPDRRAFLWVPPTSPRVRGVVVALQNMLEKPLFERAAFREACTASDVELVLIFSGRDRTPGDDKDPDHPSRTYLDLFLNPESGKPKDVGDDPAAAT